jgi:hypothetical protein
MNYDANDGSPIFSHEDHARAALRNPTLSTAERTAAELALQAINSGYDAQELDGYETISSGQADDLKHETPDGLRFWLSRTGVADGEPFENTVTIEQEQGGRWVTVCKYDGGEIEEADDDEARGKFVVEIEPGNAAMQTANDVAGALRKLADKLERESAFDWSGEDKILDANGQSVGRFTFHDHNA